VVNKTQQTVGSLSFLARVRLPKTHAFFLGLIVVESACGTTYLFFPVSLCVPQTDVHCMSVCESGLSCPLAPDIEFEIKKAKI